MGNLLTINLPKKVKVKALGNKEVEIEKIEIYEMVDSPFKKTVTAHCNNHPTKIVLWKDADYDAIGQWTDTDVSNRIIDMCSNNLL